MLLREWFFETREQWRHRNVESDSLEDVYDAQLWREFLVFDWVAFLSVPFNFALSLNVDWFQPFKHTSYSVGAVYIVVQTLPGSERFLAENMILVGVIPGPHEPHIPINTHLQPLVDDLLKLWSGVTMKSTSQTSVLARAACFASHVIFWLQGKFVVFLVIVLMKHVASALKAFLLNPLVVHQIMEALTVRTGGFIQIRNTINMPSGVVLVTHRVLKMTFLGSMASREHSFFGFLTLIQYECA